MSEFVKEWFEGWKKEIIANNAESISILEDAQYMEERKEFLASLGYRATGRVYNSNSCSPFCKFCTVFTK